MRDLLSVLKNDPATTLSAVHAPVELADESTEDAIRKAAELQMKGKSAGMKLGSGYHPRPETQTEHEG